VVVLGELPLIRERGRHGRKLRKKGAPDHGSVSGCGLLPWFTSEISAQKEANVKPNREKNGAADSPQS
jgi:hypothetical protein